MAKETTMETARTKPVNGTKPDLTVKEAANAAYGKVSDDKPAADKPAETPEQTERKARGVVPTMPAAIIYRLGGKVTAAVHHPSSGASYAQSGKGVGSAKGALEDSGFVLSTVTTDGPEWLTQRLPEGAELIGYAKIAGFPLPAQD